jgi:hypothetical protein
LKPIQPLSANFEAIEVNSEFIASIDESLNTNFELQLNPGGDEGVRVDVQKNYPQLG